MSSEILDVDPPFSFFRFAERFENPSPLKRILSLMRKNKCRTIIVHRKNLTDQTKKDQEKLVELGRKLNRREKYELLFYNIREDSLENLLKQPKCFLGFVTVCIDELNDCPKRPYILNAVVLQPNTEDKFLTCWAEYPFRFEKTDLTVKGSFFVQQHGILNVCAHASIKIALEGLRKFKPTPPSIHEINAVLNKIDHKNKIFDGLHAAEIVKVIESFGYHCYQFDFSKPPFPHINYQQMAYYGIESCFPVIISFLLGEERHVITAIGHTFNSDTWSPLADLDYFKVNRYVGYHRSSSWMDSLIIHDDNHGPYFSLPTKYLEDKEPYIIVISPYKLKIYGHVAEVFAAGELYQWIIQSLTQRNVLPSCSWMNYFMHYFNRKALILRTMLLQKKDYVFHLNHIKGKGENVAILLNSAQKLPDYFWFVEISLPELFSVNRKKIGEIIINPNLPEINQTAFDWSVALESVRLPGIFMDFITEDGTRTHKLFHGVPMDPLPIISFP